MPLPVFCGLPTFDGSEAIVPVLGVSCANASLEKSQNSLKIQGSVVGVFHASL
jgi:hypothetical protein